METPWEPFKQFVKRKKHEVDFHRKMAEEGFATQPEPMFPIPQLREAYDYFIRKSIGQYSAENFFNWLQRLEKGIPFDQQKHQP